MTAADPRRSLRLAHRGDWRQAAENTIPAMLAALDNPACDGLEFDVRLSRDGLPVLLHDLMLVRVQGVEARVDRLTAAELARHGIPSLADALAAIDERRPGAFLDIELKGTDHGGTTAAVMAAARGRAPSDAVVSSFEPHALATLRDLLPGWGRWLNADDLSPGTLAAAHELGCTAVSVQYRAVDAMALEAARNAGLDVAAWTVRGRAELARLTAIGVVAVCVEDEALDD